MPQVNIPLDCPPYVAYAVTCGITLTYGGPKVNTGAQIIGEDEMPIAGLYAAGEIVGGLHHKITIGEEKICSIRDLQV